MREFFELEWKDLGERLRQSAEHYLQQAPDGKANFSADLEEFLSRDPPNRYDDLLTRYRDAASLAIKWQQVTAIPEKQTEQNLNHLSEN